MGGRRMDLLFRRPADRFVVSQGTLSTSLFFHLLALRRSFDLLFFRRLLSLDLFSSRPVCVVLLSCDHDE